MGMPATGLESAWRNHIDDVARMLLEYHGISFMSNTQLFKFILGDQFLIWNLSERAYDYDKFQNQVCVCLY